MTIDEQKLHALVGKMITELGAAANGVLLLIGDKLGLFRALREYGPLTLDVAGETDGYERALYPRMAIARRRPPVWWTTTPSPRDFRCRPSKARCRRRRQPGVHGRRFPVARRGVRERGRLTHAFQTGEGIGWDQHCTCLFCGTERFFRPVTRRISSTNGCPRSTTWSRSSSEARGVADIGCGHGASTIIMAETFPEVRSCRRRFPRAVDRRSARESRQASQRSFRDRPRAGLRRRELRPGDDVRCAS